LFRLVGLLGEAEELSDARIGPRRLHDLEHRQRAVGIAAPTRRRRALQSTATHAAPASHGMGVWTSGEIVPVALCLRRPGRDCQAGGWAAGRARLSIERKISSSSVSICTPNPWPERACGCDLLRGQSTRSGRRGYRRIDAIQVVFTRGGKGSSDRRVGKVRWTFPRRLWDTEILSVDPRRNLFHADPRDATRTRRRHPV
jgi:hypothetical protein